MASKNWEALGHVLHTLKGMGGSYGYDIITETAAEAEPKLKITNYVGLKLLVDKLGEINASAQRGHNQ